MSLHTPQRSEEPTDEYWYAAPPPRRISAAAVLLATGLVVGLVVALAAVFLTRSLDPATQPAGPATGPSSQPLSSTEPAATSASEAGSSSNAGSGAGTQQSNRTATHAQAQPQKAAPQRPSRTTLVGDYGILTSVTVHGGTTSIVVDRVTMLTGDAARKLEKTMDGDGWPIVNNSNRLRTFPLTGSAVLIGNQQLGPGNGTQETRITAQQLKDRTPSSSDGVLVRLIHIGHLDGPVSQLSELYVP